jgi:hypothetical protein
MKLTPVPICSRDTGILGFVIDHVRPPPVSIELHALTILSMRAWSEKVGDSLPDLLVLSSRPGTARSHRR